MARNTNHRKNHKQKVAKYKLMLKQRRNTHKKKFLEALNNMYLQNIENKEQELKQTNNA